jgi:hypothetical protein
MTNPTAPARAPDEALRSEATGGRSAGARVTQATNEILDAFRTGRLAEPLAQTFLHCGLHCERWSFTNQMLVHLFGFEDAPPIGSGRTWAGRSNAALTPST